MNKRSLSLLMLLLSGLALQSFAQRRQTDVSLDKLSESLYLIKGGRGANGGVFIGETGVLVIDAKMTEEGVNQTLKAIRSITPLPIKYLVNTHSDGDHVNGNPYFPESVTIIAHENCRKEFLHPTRNGEPSRWHDPELARSIPSITFTHHMTLYLGNSRAELWYFGVGHTTGDAVVYLPEEKTAFIGDMIFADRPQLIHAYKGGNSFEYIKTQNRMLEILGADRFCSGHAEPVTRETVQSHIATMQAIQKKVVELIKKKQTLEQIQNGFEKNASRLVEVIFNEINAGASGK